MNYFQSFSTLWFMLWMTVSYGQGGDFLTLDSDSPQLIDQEIHLLFHIKPGYHIQSNQPEDDLLIPTELLLEISPTVKVEEAIFPESSLLQLGDSKLEVFDGLLLIRIPVIWEPEFNNEKVELSFILLYQPCDDRKCYFPRKLEELLFLSFSK